MVVLPGNLPRYFFSLSLFGISSLLSVVGVLHYIHCHVVLSTLLQGESCGSG